METIDWDAMKLRSAIADAATVMEYGKRDLR